MDTIPCIHLDSPPSTVFSAVCLFVEMFIKMIAFNLFTIITKKCSPHHAMAKRSKRSIMRLKAKISKVNISGDKM